MRRAPSAARPGRQVGTIEAGRYADLVLLGKNPLEDIDNLESVELVMRGGRIWRPGQLRSGIAMRGMNPGIEGASMVGCTALTRYARSRAIGSSRPTRSTTRRRSAPADSPAGTAA